MFSSWPVRTLGRAYFRVTGTLRAIDLFWQRWSFKMLTKLWMSLGSYWLVTCFIYLIRARQGKYVRQAKFVDIWLWFSDMEGKLSIFEETSWFHRRIRAKILPGKQWSQRCSREGTNSDRQSNRKISCH